MTERVLSPICSPRVRHAQTLFRSPATLSLPPLWVTSAGAEVLIRLLRLPAFFQCTVKENPMYRRRVDNALTCWVEVLRDPVGQTVCFSVRCPWRPLDRCLKTSLLHLSGHLHEDCAGWAL